MFTVQAVFLFSLVAGALTAAALAAWPWSRARGRFAVAGAATFAGCMIWNLSLRAADATGFNVDAPVIPLSGQDAGSGIMAFAVAALVLGLLERKQSAGLVVTAAAIAGVVTAVWDIFVL
jgi:hypothetical protein